MNATRLAIPDVILLEPRIFPDERGTFFESYNTRAFVAATDLDVDFVQDNHSISRKGVLRGLHYQLPPHAQGKLVRVVRGATYDVAIDLRRNSSTFGKWVAETLTAENRKQLWIPAGFAHGFLALEDGTEFLYKTSDFYDKASERTIRWDDPALAIDWPMRDVIVSPKDADAPLFADADF